MSKKIDPRPFLSGGALGEFEIFSHLDSNTRDNIAENITLKKYEKGQSIINAQSTDTEVYFLIQGKVRVCSFAYNGKQIHFEELVPGTMFGELSAIDDKERSSDCLSTTQSYLAVMTASHFRQIIREHQSVSDYVLLRLADMVRGNMQKVYEFSALSVPQRVRCELLRLASEVSTSALDTDIHLTAVPTHAEFAARINTHREAVTRELKILTALGAITWKPRSYVIHKIALLSELNISD